MVDVNGIRLFHRDAGHGAPVVLLHGYGQNNRIFKGLARYLERNYRTVLIDSRGHGQSEKGSAPISIALMANDVAALMNRLTIDHAAIVGFSDGGNIALQMAVDFPDRVSSVVAISGNARPVGLKKFYMWIFRVWKRLRAVFHLDTDMLNLLVEQPRMTNDELGKIIAPTLLIYGSGDIITRRHINELHKAIPGSVLKIILGAGHFNIMKKWRKYAEDVERFIF